MPGPEVAIFLTQRRGYLNIAHDILKLALVGCGITSIVYGGNLNFPIAYKHIGGLILRGLITAEKVGSSKLFTTTGRGREFIGQMDDTLVIWGGLDELSRGVQL